MLRSGRAPLLVACVAALACGAASPRPPKAQHRAALAAEGTFQVLHAVDFAKSSATGGIQEAIEACGSGGYANTPGCRIVLPRGSTTITRTIQLGSTGDARCPGEQCPGRSGIVLQGHASGFETTEPADHQTAGSVLRWKGPAGGSMIRLFGVSHFRLQDFSLDGDEGDDGGAAGAGIEISGDNEASRPSHGGLLENLYVTDVRDPEPLAGRESGFAIWIHGAGADTDQDQVDEIKMVRVEARDVTECLRIESSQALLDSFTGGTCAQFERYGFGVLAGSLLLADTYVGQSSRGPEPARLAGVFAGPRASFLEIRDCDFETYAGDAIRSAPEGLPGYHTLVEGTAFLMIGDPDPDPARNAAFVRYLAPRKITLLSNSFLTNSRERSVHADLRFETENADGLGVLLAGNTLTADRVHVTARGQRVSVISLDSLMSQRDPTGAAASIDLVQAGIVFSGLETITWRDGDRDVYRLQRFGEELRILDAGGRVVVRIRDGAVWAPERIAAGRSLAIGGPGTDNACLSRDPSGGIFADDDCDGSRGRGEELVERKTGSERYGPAAWAGPGTSGAVACSAQGLACLDAFPTGKQTSVPCSDATGVRFVRCR